MVPLSVDRTDVVDFVVHYRMVHVLPINFVRSLLVDVLPFLSVIILLHSVSPLHVTLPNSVRMTVLVVPSLLHFLI